MEIRDPRSFLKTRVREISLAIFCEYLSTAVASNLFVLSQRVQSTNGELPVSSRLDPDFRSNRYGNCEGDFYNIKLR